LDRCDFSTPGLQLIFDHSHNWKLRKTVRAKRNVLRIVAFFLPAETQNLSSKIMILDSLTARSLWNLDIWFKIQFRTPSPLGFAKYYSWIEKSESDKYSTKWRLESLLFLYNAMKPYKSKLEEKLKESPEIV